MPVKAVAPELGRSMPPEGPHTVTVHIPGLEPLVRFRDGDKSILPKLKSMYPRFAPWGPCREVKETYRGACPILFPRRCNC